LEPVVEPFAYEDFHTLAVDHVHEADIATKRSANPTRWSCTKRSSSERRTLEVSAYHEEIEIEHRPVERSPSG
jgi:hypothetical protein